MYIYITLLSISYPRKHSRPGPVTTQIQCTNLARIDPLAELRRTRAVPQYHTFSQRTPSSRTEPQTQNTIHKRSRLKTDTPHHTTYYPRAVPPFTLFGMGYSDLSGRIALGEGEVDVRTEAHYFLLHSTNSTHG